MTGRAAPRSLDSWTSNEAPPPSCPRGKRRPPVVRDLSAGFRSEMTAACFISQLSAPIQCLSRTAALQKSAVAHFLSLGKGLPPSPLGYIFTFDDTAIQRGRFHTLLLFSTHNVLTSPLLGPTLPNPKVTCPMSLIS